MALSTQYTYIELFLGKTNLNIIIPVATSLGSHNTLIHPPISIDITKISFKLLCVVETVDFHYILFAS